MRFGPLSTILLRGILLACALGPGLPQAALAEAVPARAAPAANEARFSRGVLWKIEAKGVAPSYVFGTIHLDDDRVLALPPGVKAAFDRSKVFAAELLDDEAAGRKFRASMVTREPQLPALLGEPTYARVNELLGAYGVPKEARGRFKPWAALLTLLQPPGNTGLILDRVLLFEAGKQKKTIHALETVEEQIAVFDGMPEESQLALLRRIIGDHDSIQDAMRPLVEAYIARDLQTMWKLNAEAMGEDADIRPHNELFLNRVFYERNERMAQRLLPLIARGNLFAAFGALHLYGDRGVLALLERRGFKLQRVY